MIAASNIVKNQTRLKKGTFAISITLIFFIQFVANLGTLHVWSNKPDITEK